MSIEIAGDYVDGFCTASFPSICSISDQFRFIVFEITRLAGVEKMWKTQLSYSFMRKINSNPIDTTTP